MLSKLLGRIPVVMSIIPTWSFFAPTPGMLDYHLMYRGIHENDKAEEWVEAFPINEKRSLLTVFWNPDKKFLKALLDLVHELVIFSNSASNTKQICLSMPYLHILNYVSSLEYDDDVQRVQFMILSNSRLYDYNVVFRSNPHALIGKK